MLLAEALWADCLLISSVKTADHERKVKKKLIIIISQLILAARSPTVPLAWTE